ncbi:MULTISPECIES: YjgB family protein [Clostridium]|uniref:DUF4309 domain-containing protein n=2 Tax=Clostridium TaxID=1485 RepID=A0A151AKU9_9CLOT|nr:MULTISPECIES: YjgB family protein [Clostridium]KYH28215.1 hypothetical protein CLCOL_21680 [Clostridium colicanis DSM 13634]MBE6044288.1 DUF4309 domain-containing protein [Clostridium thermopalmarium]PRR76581.1 hypothetical protein CPAL_02520 [Clostridium thermopalmarium DSM 5974]PVZ28306.1 uncharacterized protein DUF4309 [Clostridium thermopalmarium DSM 5974]
MSLWKKSLSIKLTIVPIILITLITGCSSTAKQTDKSNEYNSNISTNNSVDGINNPSNTNTSDSDAESLPPDTSDTPDASKNDSKNVSKGSSSTKENSTKTLLSNIMELAKKGKVINCDFPAKTTTIEDIEKAWGKPNEMNWIAAAKGVYATYPKHNMAFGFNKGSQIFEVRSFDNKIKKIPLSKVKEVFGSPDYDVNVNNEEIIGYVANKDFKILLVFPKPTKENPDPLLDHYSVFYPRGTVNLMADDPGREW